MNNFYEGEEIVTNGVIGNVQQEYKREQILLQRNISDGGDTVTVTLANQNNDTVIYIVPTQSLREVLSE